jgi:hypothetical protein
MSAEFADGNVRANCPGCSGALTTFEFRTGGQSEFGTVTQNNTVIYKLLRCAGCGRGGMATVFPGRGYQTGQLLEFYPRTQETLIAPAAVPEGVIKEFREAELCASVSAWRAASALLRSVLEKTLRANGYSKGSLADKIDAAAADGIITAARSKRAHEEVRVLGNDIMHDGWRTVTEEEFDLAHHYSQRILEDLYDDRSSVETLLREKGRLPPTA